MASRASVRLKPALIARARRRSEDVVRRRAELVKLTGALRQAIAVMRDV
jgi:hypothetical protein